MPCYCLSKRKIVDSTSAPMTDGELGRRPVLPFAKRCEACSKTSGLTIQVGRCLKTLGCEEFPFEVSMFVRSVLLSMIATGLVNKKEQSGKGRSKPPTATLVMSQ